jgi:hypothetical protein
MAYNLEKQMFFLQETLTLTERKKEVMKGRKERT